MSTLLIVLWNIAVIAVGFVSGFLLRTMNIPVLINGTFAIVYGVGVFILSKKIYTWISNNF